MHGLGEHAGRHVATAERLARQGADVVRFDLRGCGRSDGAKQWIERFDDYVDDVEAVRHWAETTLPPRPLVLMGHSLGGAVAIHAAARRPAGLSGVVLSSPAYLPGGGVSAAKIAVGRLLSRWTPRLRIPGSLDLTAISRDPAVIEAYRKDELCCSFNTVRQGDEILKALATIPAHCARIPVPVLILHGAADRLVQCEGSRTILAALGSQDKTLEVFPGGYHELYNDLERETFYEKVGEFVGRVG